MRRAIATMLLLAPEVWGQIAGRVVGEGKKGLEHVWVMWHRMPEVGVAGETTTSGGMATDGKGSFGFTGLRDGTYVLCATASVRAGYLSTCAWNPLPPRLVVKGGMAVAAQEVQMERGARVEVRLEDGQGLLPKAEDAGARGRMRVEGRPAGGGMAVGARPLERSGGEMVYVLLVPARAAVKLEVEAEGVEFEDAATGARTAVVGKDLAVMASANAGQEVRLRVKEKGR